MLPATRRSWLPIAVLLGMLAWFFGRAIVLDESFAFRDTAHYYYPLFRWCAGEWGAGRIPLWNPLENTGEPLAANAAASVFYPGKLLFAFVVLDYSQRFVLYIVAHMALAAIGSYGLARSWRGSRQASMLAALTYAFSGSVLFQYCNVTFLVGAAWLPVAILFAERAMRRRRVGDAVRFGAVMALMVLGGDPEVAYHTGLLAALYALLLWRQGRRIRAGERESGERESGERRALSCRWSSRRLLAWPRNRFVLLAVAASVGMVLGAVQILPSMNWTRASNRATFHHPRNLYEAVEVVATSDDRRQALEHVRRGLLEQPQAGLHHEHIYHFSVGPWRFIELLWPNVSGRLFPANQRWMSAIPAEGRVWTPTLYLGLVGLVMALNVWRICRGSPRTRWLSWMAMLAVLGSFGWYGLGWLAHEIRHAAGAENHWLPGSPVGGLYWLMVTTLPGYAYFRYPAKLLVFATLALSLLAARGWDLSIRSWRVRRRIRHWFASCAGLSGLALLAAVVFRGRLIESLPGTADDFFGPLDPAGAWRDGASAFVHTLLVSGIGWWLSRQASDPTHVRSWTRKSSAMSYVRSWTRKSSAMLRWLSRSASVATLFAPSTFSGIVRVLRNGHLLLTVVALDLAVANGWLIVTAPASMWRESPELARMIVAGEESSPAPPRVYRALSQGWSPREWLGKSSPERLHEALRWERETLHPKYPLLDDLALIESHGTMMNADYAALLQASRRRGPRRPDRILELDPTLLGALGTEYLVVPSEFRYPGTDVVSEMPDVALRRNPAARERVWIVREVTRIDPVKSRRWSELHEQTVRVWYRNGPGSSTSAVVEGDPGGVTEQEHADVPASNDAVPRDRCEIVSYEPGRIVIAAQLVEPGLVVLSDLYWPGWEAVVTTQGIAAPRRVPILRTNRVMRGVELGAGRHQIEMRYRPPEVFLGMIISGLGWTLLVVAGVAGRASGFPA